MRMTYYHRMVLILLCCFSLSLQLFSADTLWINAKKITLQTGLIQRNNEHYIPLRDCLSSLDAEMHFERRDLRYKLTLNKEKTTCYILPNSREFWIGSTQQFFEHPPFTKDRILYVPARSFFSQIGYAISVDEKGLNLVKSRQQTLSKARQKKQKNNGSTGPPPILTETTLFPKLDNRRPFYIAIGTDVVEMTDHFFYKEDILFINPLPFLKKSDYTLKDTADSIQLAVGNKQFNFAKTNRKLAIKTGKKTETRTLEHAPIHKKNATYFPIQSMLSLLDLSILWNPKERIISVLNKVNQVEVISEKKGPKIVIHSALPIAQESDFFDTEKGFYVDIPFTNVRVRSTQFTPEKTVFSGLNITEIAGNQSRLSVDYKKNYVKEPYLTTTDDGAQIRFYPRLNKLSENMVKETLYLTLEINEKIPYQLTPDSKTHQLHFVFPETLSKIPEFFRPKSTYIDTIRTKVIHGKTPKTILTIQLKNKAKLLRHEIIDGHLKMVIRPLKPRKIKQPILSKSRPLKGRIIAIDAGHGGRDPGGIGIHRTYEKHYTLEIAKDLRERLKRDGAHVIMSRTKDSNTSLTQRTRQANLSKADIFISIHMNSFKSSGPNGTETYYHKPKDKKLAAALQKELTKTLKLKNNGLKKNRLYVLKYSKMPAALVEPGFLTNPKDFKKLSKESVRKNIAKALHQGILNYYN